MRLLLVREWKVLSLKNIDMAVFRYLLCTGRLCTFTKKSLEHNILVCITMTSSLFYNLKMNKLKYFCSKKAVASKLTPLEQVRIGVSS